MSETTAQSTSVCSQGVLGGVLATTALGGLVGILWSAASWPRPVTLDGAAAFAWMVFAGLVVGGGVGGVLSLVLAWQGAATEANPESPPAAPLWGVATSLVCGLLLGPLAGFVLGLAVSQMAGGAQLGLVCGPLLAILGWQSGYWTPRCLDRWRGA